MRHQNGREAIAYNADKTRRLIRRERTAPAGMTRAGRYIYDIEQLVGDEWRVVSFSWYQKPAAMRRLTQHDR
jgi:hypothetical protein